MSEEKIRRVFLCRHGETEANVIRRYCGGQRETPLTEKGKIQGLLIGKALGIQYSFRGKHIVSSHLGRAQETADKIILGLGYPLEKIIMPYLRESDMGEWCGKSSEELEKLFPEEHKKWREGNITRQFQFPNGESLMKASWRMNWAFRKIKNCWLEEKEDDNNDIIIVAHGGTNMMILAGILGIEQMSFNFRALRQENACINIIGFHENNIWRPSEEIMLINSTSHLYFREEKTGIINP